MALQRLRKDDTVMVIAGRERGKTGKVLRVLADRDRVLIEHVNMVKRHQKARSVQQPGGIVEKEASIHMSNVVPVCGRCNKPTRVGHRRLEDGRGVRVCRRCDELLDNA
ncbi:MAG TPA: 50S ribosomal protein L24 [Candidatus Binatia bacterium]|jgi:large subunit ribosomal protein L24|nr:50S ribosomal protein L24 [Candidatus Binatia bacterium]